MTTRYINTTNNEFKLTEENIKEMFPNTSFSNPFKPFDEFMVVFSTPEPEVDVLHVAKEVTPTLTDKGVYEQTWVVEEKYQNMPNKIELETAEILNYKMTLISGLNEKKAIEEQAGFYFNDVKFDSDFMSVVRINSAAQYAMSDSNYVTVWSALDNQAITLNAVDMINFHNTLTEHMMNVHKKYRKIKDDILGAVFLSEIDLLVLNFQK